jgi:hypothetical protein
MSLTQQLQNMVVVDGTNFEDRYGLQGSGSITKNIFVIGANGTEIALAFVSSITSANLLKLNSLPVGSVIFESSTGNIYQHNAAATWQYGSGSVRSIA